MPLAATANVTAPNGHDVIRVATSILPTSQSQEGQVKAMRDAGAGMQAPPARPPNSKQTAVPWDRLEKNILRKE